MPLRAVGWSAVWAPVLFAVACRPAETDGSRVQVELSWSPSPPRVGKVDVLLNLTDSQGSPFQHAHVQLEGNMNHAGMKPSFAELEEIESGVYSGTLDFTMGGDWFVLVSVTPADGRPLVRKIDVPGVKVR